MDIYPNQIPSPFYTTHCWQWLKVRLGHKHMGSLTVLTMITAIYANLVLIEAKLREIGENYLQTEAQTHRKISNDTWGNISALHRKLLHEHQDFFVASQHPSASCALKSLASKYSMPTRKWQHGIHAFLKMLRQRGPDTLEYMRNFVSSTSTVIGQLMESVPGMMNQWTKISKGLEEYDSVLGDLECQVKRELSDSSLRSNGSTPVVSHLPVQNPGARCDTFQKQQRYGSSQSVISTSIVILLLSRWSPRVHTRTL